MMTIMRRLICITGIPLEDLPGGEHDQQRKEESGTKAHA